MEAQRKRRGTAFAKQILPDEDDDDEESKK